MGSWGLHLQQKYLYFSASLISGGDGLGEGRRGAGVEGELHPLVMDTLFSESCEVEGCFYTPQPLICKGGG